MRYTEAGSLVIQAQGGDKAALEALLAEAEISLRSVWLRFVDHPDDGHNPDVVSFLDPDDAAQIARLVFVEQVMSCPSDKANYIFGPSTLHRVADALRVERVGGGVSRESARALVDAANATRSDVGATSSDGSPEVAGLSTDESVMLVDNEVSKGLLMGYMAASNPVSYDALMSETYDEGDPWGDGFESTVERDDFLPSDPWFQGQRVTADDLEPVQEPVGVSYGLSLSLSDAVSQLTKQQQVVALLTAEGFGPTEIADQLGLSEETVKVHKKAAMAHLREILGGVDA